MSGEVARQTRDYLRTLSRRELKNRNASVARKKAKHSHSVRNI